MGIAIDTSAPLPIPRGRYSWETADPPRITEEQALHFLDDFGFRLDAWQTRLLLHALNDPKGYAASLGVTRRHPKAHFIPVALLVWRRRMELREGQLSSMRSAYRFRQIARRRRA